MSPAPPRPRLTQTQHRIIWELFMPKMAKPQHLQEIEAMHARVAELERAVGARDREIAKLRQTKSQYSLILESVEWLFWLLTPDLTQFVYISPAYERIWGRSTTSLYESPQSFIEAVHPDDRQRVIAELSQHGMGSWSVEYRIIRPDGDSGRR